MNTLINIELRKSLNYRTFWILLALHFILSCLIIVFIQKFLDLASVSSSGGGVTLSSGLTVYLFFPKIWNTVTFIGGYLHILLAAIVIISIGNEFSYKTIRQNIISGLSIQEFIISKLVLCVLLAIYSALLMFVLGILMGFQHTTDLTFYKFIAQLHFIPLYFLQTFLFLNLALFVGIIFKKAALSIAFLFVYVFLIENLILFLIQSPIKNYLPNTVITKLIPSPDHVQATFSTVPSFIIIPALVSGFIFLVLGYFILKRKDL